MQSLYHLIRDHQCSCGGELHFLLLDGRMYPYLDFLKFGYSLYAMKNILATEHVKVLYCPKCHAMYAIDWSSGWPRGVSGRQLMKDFGVLP